MIRGVLVLLLVAAVGGYIALLKVRLANCQADKAQVEAAHKILVATVQLQNDRIADAGKATLEAKARGQAAVARANAAAVPLQAELERLKAAAAAGSKGKTCADAISLIRGGL